MAFAIISFLYTFVSSSLPEKTVTNLKAFSIIGSCVGSSASKRSAKSSISKSHKGSFIKFKLSLTLVEYFLKNI